MSSSWPATAIVMSTMSASTPFDDKAVGYGQAWGRALPWILLFSLAVATVAYSLTSRSGVTYQVHFSYIVSLTERESSTNYRFDGFYALQATDLFTTTLANWLTTPETIVMTYQTAGLALPTNNARQLSRLVQAEKAAPQLIRVVVAAPQRDQAQKIAASLQEVMKQQIDHYQDQGIPALRFQALATQPWISQQTVALFPIVVGSFVLALVLSSNFVVLRHSLKAIG